MTRRAKMESQADCVGTYRADWKLGERATDVEQRECPAVGQPCGVASPESVADAADSLNALSDGAEFPPQAEDHDVDCVAATVVTRAPYLADEVGTRHRRGGGGGGRVQPPELEG